MNLSLIRLLKKSAYLFVNLTLIMDTLFLVYPQSTHADDIISITIKKTESKRKMNWSISDWIETKQIMRIQDMWLARHLPSPFEFYLDGNYQFQNTSGLVSAQQSGWQGSFAAYATFVGLEFKVEQQAQPRIYGLFNLRLLGYHNQGTNLTLQGGFKKEPDQGESSLNLLAGLNLTLYFNKAFGVAGSYLKVFPQKNSDLGRQLAGYRAQGGLFIDYLALRVYGDYFRDSNSLYQSFGFLTGLRLYF